MIVLWPHDESNRGLQVIAMLMAIALWIFVALLPRIDSDKRKLVTEIHVKYAAGLIALRTNPAVAEVQLEGPKVALSKLGEQDVEVFVDVKKQWQGHPRSLPLSVSGPPGVKWEVSPAEVQVVQP